MVAQGDVGVVVPAAGSGTRMGGAPKQFRSLGGVPLLVQTLRRFDTHPEVGQIVVAVPPDEVASTEARLRTYALEKLHAVVAGGETRQASVAKALGALSREVGLVLVHDAVRPFVRAEHVTGVIRETRTHGAATLAVPCADTVRRGAGGVFGETVPREGLWLVQTPQAFRRDWLEAAHAAARSNATDDVALVQGLGHPVRIVPGSPRNFKITTPEDWALAEMIWACTEQEPAEHAEADAPGSAQAPQVSLQS